MFEKWSLGRKIKAVFIAGATLICPNTKPRVHFVQRNNICSVNRKNFTLGYSETQIKVRAATSNDPWGPSGQEMAELARATFKEYRK